MIDKSTFELDKELLHGGKGKNNDVIELNYDEQNWGTIQLLVGRG